MENNRNEMTRNQLYSEAKQLGADVKSNATKAELLELLENHYVPEKPLQEEPLEEKEPINTTLAAELQEFTSVPHLELSISDKVIVLKQGKKHYSLNTNQDIEVIKMTIRRLIDLP
jgi:hypothetical protein